MSLTPNAKAEKRADSQNGEYPPSWKHDRLFVAVRILKSVVIAKDHLEMLNVMDNASPWKALGQVDAIGQMSSVPNAVTLNGWHMSSSTESASRKQL